MKTRRKANSKEMVSETDFGDLLRIDVKLNSRNKKNVNIFYLNTFCYAFQSLDM